jgi:hypothetical protein
MRSLMLLLGTLVGCCLYVAVPAIAAPTCADRQKACHRYCDDKMSTSIQCDPACDSLFSSCVETGCWDSPVAGKKCGYVKR